MNPQLIMKNLNKLFVVTSRILKIKEGNCFAIQIAKVALKREDDGDDVGGADTDDDDDDC